MVDVVIRGGTVVTPEGTRVTDIRIAEGKIAAVALELPGAFAEIDARGLHIFPGVMDIHVHFNEPGRTEWEGAASGSRALAAGGGTSFFDMPLNSTPCTVNAGEFRRKQTALEAASIADFAIWAGLVPGNVREMPELAVCGAVGFKAFLCDSGLPEFPRADDVTLLDGMREAARLGLPIAVHAESQEITSNLARRFLDAGLTDARDFLASRPVIAELEAIQRAILLATETGVKLHIVHVSSGRGAVLAAEARAHGADVSIETCPHYLCFTEEDVDRLGALAKCTPPLRPRGQQEALWNAVLAGSIDIVASDHSPAPPHMKSGEFWYAWGGIAGVQSTLTALLDQGCHGRALPVERVAALLATEPARRFLIGGKGAIQTGNDADLALVDLAEAWDLQPEHLFQRHALSPYVGRHFRGKVRRTIRRGETLYADGCITSESHGRLMRPERN